MHARRILWIQLALALLLAACGGGGGPAFVGSTVIFPPDFTGSYVSLTVGQDYASFGDGVADGAGAFLGSETRNRAGVLGDRAIDATFSVDPDGTVAWKRLFGVAGHGCMTADGAFGAMDDLGLRLLLARTGTHTDASIQGVYRYCLFGDTPAGEASAILGTMDFDGAGGLTFSIETLNTEGVITTGLPDSSGDYEVVGDSELTMTIGSLSLEGGIGLGGELIVLAGGASNGQSSSLAILVKQQPGTAGAHLLNGRYGSFGHQSFLGPFGIDSSQAYFTADGGGTTHYRRVEGFAGPTPGGFLPYTIAPDGQLDFTVGADVWRGAITSSGEVAILGGGTATDNDPLIMVLIRKRSVAANGAIPLALLDSGIAGTELISGGVFRIVDFASSITTDRRIHLENSGAVLGRNADGRLRFDLSSLPPGATIASATLVTTQDAVDGTPFDTGSVVVDHIDIGSVLDSDDADPVARPGGVNIGTLSSTPDLGQRILGVTAAVQLDLADGRQTADFGLRLLGGGSSSSGVTFDDHSAPGPSAGSRTRLLITLN